MTCLEKDCSWKKDSLSHQQTITTLKKFLSIERDRTQRAEKALQAEREKNESLHQKVGKLEYQIVALSSEVSYNEYMIEINILNYSNKYNLQNYRTVKGRLASNIQTNSALIDISCTAGYYGHSQPNTIPENSAYNYSTAKYTQHVRADNQLNSYNGGETVDESSWYKTDHYY